VARPSIVVGRYRDRIIGQFTNIYALIRLVAAGRIHILPANPCASLDLVPIDHVIGGLTDIAARMAAAGRAYHLVSGAPSRAVRGCAPVSVSGTPWFQQASGPFAALPHPPPAEVNPPTDRLTHRYRATAAGTDIVLVCRRRGEFARSKITVDDLVVGVSGHATADCTLRTDDLLAFTRDQHVTGPCCMPFTAHHQTKSSGAASPLIPG
jgi:hypothetical protein